MPGYDAELFDPPAPMATVALRTLDRQRSAPDVVMQIDSGADVSLVPESSVRRLGLEPDEQRGYEVMAFDGSTRVATSVRCDLIFLGRAYGGVFLVVEGPYGILGRDILNHVALVLDGPRLNWREEHASE